MDDTNSGPLDRASLFPSRPGPNTLPNNPLFSRLLRHAHHPDRVAITDINLGVTKTYADLVSDVLTFRNVLRERLKAHDVAHLDSGDEIYVGILLPGGYEWAVAMLSVLALGVAAVPMSVNQPAAEVRYLVEQSRAVGLICGRQSAHLAVQVNDQMPEYKRPFIVDVIPNIPTTPHFPARSIVVSSNKPLSDDSPALVIFTSGTTGRPKGCVLRRLYTHESAATVADSFDITFADTVLHTLPVHHATGIGTSFFPFMWAGATVVFRSGGFDEGWVWERLVDGSVSVFSGVPTMFMRLMWFYKKRIASLPEGERARYDEGVKRLRVLLCGSSALQQRVQDFWTKLRGGKAILVRYGSSEVPSVIRVPARMDPATVPKGCVGLPTAGLDWKLSGEGELLLRSPFMFSKYLHDRGATVAAHTAEGYFRTGDLAHVDEQGFVFIDGRLSTDIIKSGGYKVGAPDIERAILELPGIKEAMVVGVQDEEWGQRVGAAVVLAKGGSQLSLGDLRRDLRNSLPGYKLPTLLRVVDGELPKGETGKVQKKILGPKYFVPEKWREDPDIQVWKAGRSAKL